MHNDPTVLMRGHRCRGSFFPLSFLLEASNLKGRGNMSGYVQWMVSRDDLKGVLLLKNFPFLTKNQEGLICLA